MYLAITIISISLLILMLYGFRSSLFSSQPENLKVLGVCGITPKDTTSISRSSKGLRFFNPLMSGLCLECLGDGTRRVVSVAALTVFWQRTRVISELSITEKGAFL